MMMRVLVCYSFSKTDASIDLLTDSAVILYDFFFICLLLDGDDDGLDDDFDKIDGTSVSSLLP